MYIPSQKYYVVRLSLYFILKNFNLLTTQTAAISQSVWPIYHFHPAVWMGPGCHYSNFRQMETLHNVCA